ncbi:MAG: hypothetical protein R2716_05890 [Microthrixaceae bacterium]
MEQEPQVSRGFADYSGRAARYSRPPLRTTARARSTGWRSRRWRYGATKRRSSDSTTWNWRTSSGASRRSTTTRTRRTSTCSTLMNLRIGYPSQLQPAVARAIDDRILGFKYWYTDSTPDVLDNRWYWSENHRIIFHTLELLAGEMFPDRVFEVPDGDGEEMTGEDHVQRATGFITDWLDEKARYGFSEWPPTSTTKKDLTPLLTRGVRGGPRDRGPGHRDAGPVPVRPGDAPGEGQRRGDPDALREGQAEGRRPGHLRSAAGPLRSFRPAIRARRPGSGAVRTPSAELPPRCGRLRSPEQFEDVENMGVEIDPGTPSPRTPESEDGLSCTDPDMVPFWWERGALTPWQTVPLTLATADEYDLWDTELFSQFKAVRDVSGGDVDVAVQLASTFAPLINIALLSAVETRTWRDDGVMLSSAVDYRPGRFGHQYHAWQATLGEDEIVFTTSPGNEPRQGDRWEDGDLYWNGGVQPLSHQSGPASVQVYRPVYANPGPGLLEAFSYLPLTHAYVPTETFDEVVQVPEPPGSAPWGSWLFARSGDRFVALWSWRPTSWRDHSGDGTPTGGLSEPFDLVAEGGADNVWVAEVGREGEGKGRYADFAAFREAMLAATPRVTQEPPGPDGLPGRFSVLYDSPGAGVLGVAPDGTRSIDGETVESDPTVRFDHPFTQAEAGQDELQISAGGQSLAVNLATGERAVG